MKKNAEYTTRELQVEFQAFFEKYTIDSHVQEVCDGEQKEWNNASKVENGSYPKLNDVYELVRELGQGGTSKVYLGRHMLTD